MKKLMANKKLSMTILAGVLVTAMVLAGTWAYFTTSSAVPNSDYQLGTVGLTGTTASTAYNFYQLFDADSRANYDAFETVGSDAAFAALIAATKPKLFIVDAVTNPLIGTPDSVNNVYVSKINPNNLTPGSLISAVFTFTNTSSVPVYFRVDGPNFVTTDAWYNVLLTQVAHYKSFEVNVPGAPGAIIVENPVDNKLYCNTAIEPGDTIEVTVDAFVLGVNNTTSVQGAYLRFNSTVDVIQAIGFSVAYEAGWTDMLNDAVLGPFFIPYN